MERDRDRGEVGGSAGGAGGERGIGPAPTQHEASGRWEKRRGSRMREGEGFAGRSGGTRGTAGRGNKETTRDKGAG
eukprot:gene17054-7556_t